MFVFFLFDKLYAVALDQSHQNQDDGDDQQNVDETAHGVGRYQAKQPGDD